MRKVLSVVLAIVLTMSIIPMFTMTTYALDSRVEKAIEWAIAIANDDSHGYSRTYRNGPDYDCSSFVSTAFKQGGFGVSGSLNTSSMAAAFTKVGFTQYSKGAVSIQRGDILLKPGSHVELYLGNNTCVAAHDDVDGVSGDGNGKEIEVRTRNWCTFCKNAEYTYVLRYEGETPPHTCNKGTYVFYEASHPHYNCYRCSICGTVNKFQDEPNTAGGCADCAGTNMTISSGIYCLKSNSTNTYLNVADGQDVQAQNIDVHGAERLDASQFEITPSTTTGGYTLRPICCASRVVNVYAETVASGKNVCIYDNTGDSSQRWTFEKVTGGVVVRNVQSPNCVLTESGANVIVSTYTGAASQVWKLQNVIVYNANGGSNAPSHQVKDYDSVLTLSSTKPTRDGYTFLGWATSPTAKTVTYSASGSFTANENTTLYAVWGNQIEYGNVDKVNGINAADALMALQAATDKILLTDEEKTAADVDGQNGVTANDALMILQYATKKIAAFPVAG